MRATAHRILSGSRIATATALLVALAPPATTARADVLVSRPDPELLCGEAITTGVWYRDFPTRGARKTTIEIRSATGALLSRRTVTATKRWRYFRYTPRCGQRYRVRYRTVERTTTFVVRVLRD